MKIHIVGAGLIGTSIGLALKQRGDTVTFADTNVEHLQFARDLVGVPSEGGNPSLVIVATPPAGVFSALKEQFSINPQAMFIEISGLKSELLLQVDELPELARRFCGTHPMAGRELSGPTAARADLFQGATWIITPTALTDDEVLEAAKNIALELGSVVRVVGANKHDELISGVSHLPQAVSTILARTLSTKSEEELGLAGQGLRDLTRLADSNPKLWADLLIRNRSNVIQDLRKVASEIEGMLAHLESENESALEEFIRDGGAAKSRIPGKHGGKSREYVYLPIVIEDKAGQLAAIFDECAAAGVNVEDLFIEHSPGQETGLITLALSQDDANILRPHLVEKNWRVHGIRANR